MLVDLKTLRSMLEEKQSMLVRTENEAGELRIQIERAQLKIEELLRAEKQMRMPRKKSQAKGTTNP